MCPRLHTLRDERDQALSQIFMLIQLIFQIIEVIGEFHS